MSNLLSHMGRFFVISIAYLLAITVACAFLLFLAWGGFVQGDPEMQWPAGFVVSLALPLVVLFAARYAFFPMIVMVAIAEIGGRRSWLFHALSGMAIAVSALIIRANSEQLANPSAGILMAVLAAGAVGGSVYWLIAGRTSGRNLDRLADDLTSRASKES